MRLKRFAKRVSMIVGVSCLLGLGGLSATAWAGEQVATEQTSVKKAKKKNPNKRICKKVKPVGSHLPQRVCLKQRKWDEIETAAQRTIRNSTEGSIGN